MLDLKMEVYTPSLDLIGFLEAYKSVIWSEKAFSAGKFSLESLMTAESMNMLKPDNIIWIEGDTAGIIMTIQEQSGPNGPYITVSGPTLTGILDRRVLWGLYSLRGTVPEIMHQLVNDCCINPTRGDAAARKMPGLVLTDAPAGGDTIQIQATGGTLLERLETLGETYGVAFGVRFNPAVPQMEFWTRYGENRSIHQSDNSPVLYSTELDDVLSSEYTYNSQGYRNVCLVAGEGDGADRVYVTVENEVEEPDKPIPPAPPGPELVTQYTVTLLVDPAGGGTAAGGKTVAAGASITVTATENDGYTFSEWQEDGQTVITSKSYTFTVNRDRTLTAVFSVGVKTYSINAAVDPSGAGTVTGAGKYQQGTTVNLQATANDGYSFSDWKENGATVYSIHNYSFTAEKDRNLVASFSEKKPSRLPAKYTELEYIESDGAQYIDTGIIPSRTTKVNMDVEPTRESSVGTAFVTAANGQHFMGVTYPTSPSTSQISAYTCGYCVTWTSGGVYAGLGRITKTAARAWGAVEVNSDGTPRRMTILVDPGARKVYIDGTGGGSFSSTFTNNYDLIEYSLTLLSRIGSNNLAARLYSCQIDVGAARSRDFVPCINPSGAVGLYDLVSGTFYGNAGTGVFTAGPAV